MATPNCKFRLELPCKSIADFDRQHAERFSRDFFVPTDTSLAPDETVEVQLVLTTGELGRHGNATVIASDSQKGRAGLLLRFEQVRSDGLIAQNDPGRVLDFENANPTRPSIQSQQIAETIRSEPEITIEMDPPTPVPLESQPVEAKPVAAQAMEADPDERLANAHRAASTSSDTAPQRNHINAIVALLAIVVASALAFFFLFQDDSKSEPAMVRPDKNESAAVAKNIALTNAISTADSHLAAGRLTGADSALQVLLKAQTQWAADIGIKTRLTALADTFEQLAASALNTENLPEAATHFQAVLLADPSRTSARTKMREIEEKILSHQHDKGTGE